MVSFEFAIGWNFISYLSLAYIADEKLTKGIELEELFYYINFNRLFFCIV